MRLGEERFGSEEALGATPESCSAKPWEDQVVKWMGGARSPALVFEAPWVGSLMSCRWIHHLLERENCKDS